MNSESKQLTTYQLFVLVFGFTIGTSVLIIPSSLAEMAREDAWLGAIVNGVCNVCMIVLYIALARLYPGKNLYQICEKVLGVWLGKAVAIIFLFFTMFLTSLLLGGIGFFVTNEILPLTPVEAIDIYFLLVVVVATHVGIQAFARVTELMLPFILFFVFVLTAALLPQANLPYVMPILEDGIAPALKSGLHTSTFQEMIILMMFHSLVQDQKQAEKALIAGTALGSLVLAIIVALCVLVMGVEQSANYTFSAFAVAKMINIGGFLQRIEGVLVTFWMLTIFIKTVLCLYAVMMGIKGLFGLKSGQFIAAPIAVFILGLSWGTCTSQIVLLNFTSKDWFGYALVMLVILPLMLYGVGVVRTRWLQRS